MKVVICDDNAEQMKEYETYLKKFFKEENISADILKYENGVQLLFDLEDIKDEIDVIFLDINMPKLSGVEVAKKIQDMGCISEIIFLTVSKEHWMEAFDLGVSNYIVKGETSKDRFDRIVRKSLAKAKEASQEYLLLTGGGEHRQIPIKSISHFELRDRIVTVYYGDDECFEFFSNLNKVQERLFEFGFFRIHRSYLVALSKIVSLAYHKQGEVTMQDGSVLPVGRTQYAELKTILKKEGK